MASRHDAAAPHAGGGDLAGQGDAAVQSPHTARRPSQLAGCRAAVFCVAGPDAPAVGAPGDALCHTLAV